MTNQKNNGCSSCGRKKFKKSEIALIILSFYLLFSCVYGTIQLVKDLIEKF